MIYKDFVADKFDINYINTELQNKHWSDVLNNILKWADCTRVYQDGTRPISTIHYAYKTYDWQYQYVLDYAKAKGADVSEYENKFIELHRKNIEFETINPPIVYEGKKRKVAKSTSKTRKVRTTDMFTGETTVSTIDNKGGITRSKKIKMPEGKLVFNFNKK